MTSAAIRSIIDVEHVCADGWHEFTSLQVPGFYLIAPKDDLPAAFDDIPAALSALIEADTGEAVQVAHEQTYDEYGKALPADVGAAVHHYSIEKRAA